MELFDDDSSDVHEHESRETAAAFSELESLLEQLKELAPEVRDEVRHALLYGCSDHTPANPPFAAIKRFAQKVLAAAETASTIVSEEARRRAEQARVDRLDPDTELVHNAAYKVRREFDRLRGLLRFRPEPVSVPEPASIPETEGAGLRYTARCAPDHFVLPLLAEHFWLRFGGRSGSQSWAIIDEKRNLVLISEAGGKPVLRVRTKRGGTEHGDTDLGPDPIRITDEWEGLWKKYHRSINNESRANPKLQKQFMPRRYWKYLTEME